MMRSSLRTHRYQRYLLTTASPMSNVGAFASSDAEVRVPPPSTTQTRESGNRMTVLSPCPTSRNVRRRTPEDGIPCDPAPPRSPGNRDHPGGGGARTSAARIAQVPRHGSQRRRVANTPDTNRVRMAVSTQLPGGVGQRIQPPGTADIQRVASNRRDANQPAGARNVDGE